MLKYTDNYNKIYGFYNGKFKRNSKNWKNRVFSKQRRKELIWKYAETVGMKPSRLIRNIVLLQAESKLRGIEDLAIKIQKILRNYRSKILKWINRSGIMWAISKLHKCRAESTH